MHSITASQNVTFLVQKLLLESLTIVVKRVIHISRVSIAIHFRSDFTIMTHSLSRTGNGCWQRQDSLSGRNLRFLALLANHLMMIQNWNIVYYLMSKEISKKVLKWEPGSRGICLEYYEQEMKPSAYRVLKLVRRNDITQFSTHTQLLSRALNMNHRSVAA